MAAAPVLESADVQLEHGFMLLANRLVEALSVAEFIGAQTKIVLALWRDTYGWKEDAVSVALPALASKCGVAYSGGFRRAFEELVQEGVVLCVVQRERQIAGTYMVQKDFAKWGRFSIAQGKLAALWDKRPEHVAVKKEAPAKPKPEKKAAPNYVARAVEIWSTERDGAILDFGVAGKHLQPVAKLLGEEDMLARWTAYCQRTKGDGWASPANFKQHHPLYSANGKGSSERALHLWHLYVKVGLTSHPQKAEVERIASDLVAAGEYPSAQEFITELRVAEPWTLRDARSDQWAAEQIQQRLAAK